MKQWPQNSCFQWIILAKTTPKWNGVENSEKGKNWGTKKQDFSLKKTKFSNERIKISFFSKIKRSNMDLKKKIPKKKYCSVFY